jgi:rhodanese-related sulfurtransferase
VNEVIRTFRGFAILVVVGIVVGLAANAANPKGLSLTRNYFAKVIVKDFDTQPGPGSRPTGGGGTATKPVSQHATQPAEMTEEEMVDAVKKAGFQPLYHREVVEIYDSVYRTDGLYVFIDARDDKLYQEGHLPGSYQLDHYYIDKYIEPVLEACKIAEKIVVYCNGGTCEDSELAVSDLIDKEVGPHKLFIYAGGFTMWKDKGRQFETGDRNSGQIKQESPKNGVPASQGAQK